MTVCCGNIFAAQGRTFRGGALENLGDAPMLKGHDNSGQPFDVETACYLKPVFAEYDRAVHNGTRLKLVLKAGVKTVKSFSLEVCAADHVCNRNGDAAIFFGTESAAETTATTRILDFYRTIPRFQRKMETLRSRFDDTMGALKFPDKTLFILAANLGNCQQKNLGFTGLQDAFVTGATGMIEEMIARTTQYEKEAIIFLESQGGENGFDFDRHYDDTDQRELHVLCPVCGHAHIWNWRAFDEASMTRPDDFMPHAPLAIPSLDQPDWIEHHRPLLLATERRVAGFKRGPDELIKLETGEYNEVAILRETHFECYHCGALWKDIPAIREQLDRSSHFIGARKDALPFNVGFNIPQWINRRLSWGRMMLEKLNAQKVAAELGNYEPLKKWWQKTAARTWSDNVIRVKTLSVETISSIDPKLRISNELFRSMEVDCQKDKQLSAIKGEDMTGHFWVTAFATDSSGNDMQLWRGYCTSWEEWISKYKELGIPTKNISVDASFKPDEVKSMAARNAEIITEGGLRVYATWTMMRGSDRHSFRWDDGINREYQVERPEQVTLYADNGKNARTINVNVISWSNFRIKNILDGILRKTAIATKMTRIEDRSAMLTERTRAMETGDCTWDNQMNSEIPGESLTTKKAKWVAIHKENHYRDCVCMHIVRKLQAGFGGYEAAEIQAQKVE